MGHGPPAVPGISDTLVDPVVWGPQWFNLLLDRVVFQGLDTTQPEGNYRAVDNITVYAPIVTDLADSDGAIGIAAPSSRAIFGFETIALGWVTGRHGGAPAAKLVRK